MKAKVAVVGFAVLASTAGFGAVATANAALVTVPAPPSGSSGVAVQVGDLVSVGKTEATAGPSGGTASAAPVKLGEVELLGGVTKATKSTTGALLDTGPTPLGRVAVAPWSTEVSGNQAGSTTAVATVELNGIGDVSVAPSSSFATWSPSQSNSSAVSDGAVIRLGDQTIKVLHSQSNGSGQGRTYLVQLLGRSVGATDQSGCMLDVGPVAAVGCLKALDGAASAQVAQALLGDASALGKVVATVASGGVGIASSGTSITAAETSRGVAPTLLARTGANVLTLVALALLITVAGATAVRGTRSPLVVALPARR